MKLSKKFEHNASSMRLYIDKSRFYNSINEVSSPVIAEVNADDDSLDNKKLRKKLTLSHRLDGIYIYFLYKFLYLFL